MFNPLHDEMRRWLLNPAHPMALAAVTFAILAAAVVQALAR
jgi:hypothetical protein